MVSSETGEQVAGHGLSSGRFGRYRTVMSRADAFFEGFSVPVGTAAVTGRVHVSVPIAAERTPVGTNE